MPVAPAGQEAHRLPGRLSVVGGNGGEIVKAQIAGNIGQQHAWDDNLLKLQAEQLSVPAQEHDSRRLALPAQLDRVGHLVGVLVQVIYRGVPPRIPQENLNALHQIGEQHVLGALDDDGDAGTGLLLEMFGVLVGLEAVGLHHRQNLLPGFLADIRMIVEHPGHRRHAAAGQPGNILNRHASASSPRAI